MSRVWILTEESPKCYLFEDAGSLADISAFFPPFSGKRDSCWFCLFVGLFIENVAMWLQILIGLPASTSLVLSDRYVPVMPNWKESFLKNRVMIMFKEAYHL